MCLKRALYFGPSTPPPPHFLHSSHLRGRRRGKSLAWVRGAARVSGPWRCSESAWSRPFPALFGWPGLRCSLARQRDKPICQWGGGFWKLLSPPPHRGP